MNISLIGVPLITIPFQHHTTVKNPILHCLDQLPQTSIISGDSISKTDWNTNEDRSYWNILYPHVEQTMRNAMSSVDIPQFSLSPPWYQQYHQKDYHAWHRHPQSVYNVVYYIELPDNTPPTILRNPVDKQQIITPNVKEGDLLIFPSCLIHCSPPNESSQRKTIIAFNVI